MLVEKLICLKCGNTREFVVDATCYHLGATLIFEGNKVVLEDTYLDDADITPMECAECGADIGGSTFLPTRREVVCNQCSKKFECFTGNEPCTGFVFADKGWAELE